MSSTIEWLARPGTKPESWNPTTGCTKVSAGCKHCYAETVANRFWVQQYGALGADGLRARRPPGDTSPILPPRPFTDVQCHEDRLSLPLSWRAPRTCFVNSMSDLFHEAVPDAFIDRVFAVMALAPKHTFIILTKRPERMRTYFSCDRVNERVADATARTYDQHGGEFCGWAIGPMFNWEPLPNVILGVSVEDQATADLRVPILFQTPAAVRVVSYEPALGPVDFVPFFRDRLQPGHVWRDCLCSEIDPIDRPCVVCVAKSGLDWLIVGGESGPKARPCQVEWIRAVRDQCAAAGVPCFVKQLGAAPQWDRDESKRYLRSRKGNDPAEWPDDLRVREWPEVRA